MVTTAVLGGEAKARGAFSGRGSRGVLIAWVVWAAGSVVLILTLSLGGLITALVLAGVLRVVTLGGGTEHTVVGNLADRRVWRFMRRHGFEEFIPAAHRPVNLTRRDRRKFNAYREWPDGVDGMYFLEARPGRPAVAYHYPPDQSPYLSVAFAVDGPVVGLAGGETVERAQRGFGELMAGWGSQQKLVSGIQVVTRMLPADTATHAAWLTGQLDPEVPAAMVADYGQLLAAVTSSAFPQRHYVVIRWNQTARFTAAAGRYAPGRDGWLQLVNNETAAAQRRLTEAGYREVRALTGPQIAAVIRHLQHPDNPIDQASDVTPATMFLPSHAEWGWVEVTDQTGVSWVHRTAQIPPRALETVPRNGLWLNPLLTGRDTRVVRTVAVHIHFIPAQDAKRTAKLDATGDRADVIGQQRKGKIVDDEVEMALVSAQDRLADVRNGTGHHGAVWAGFITISTPTTEALPQAVAEIEEAADACGINRLHWLDARQAAAQSLTWPVARGLTPPRRRRSDRTSEWVLATSAKETA